MRRPSFLLALFLAGLVMRLGTALTLGETKAPEMYEYGMIARNLLHGHGFAMPWPYLPLDPARKALLSGPPSFESAYMPPLYPYHIYLVFLVCGDTPAAALALMLLNVLYGSLTPVLVYLIAGRLLPERAARVSGIAAALFAPAMFGVVTFSGSTLYQATLCAALYGLVRGMQEPWGRWPLLAGAAAGLLTLQRSEFLFAAVLLFGYAGAVVYRNTGSVKAGGMLLAGLMACLLLVAPWTLRNWGLFGAFVPVISRPWHEVWRGNNPYATGGAYNTAGQHVWLDDPALYGELIRRIDAVPYTPRMELEIDRILKEEALRFARTHPGQVVRLALRKLVMLWTFDPYYPPARHPVFLLSILTVAVPFWIGFVRYIRAGDRAAAGLWGVFLVYYAGVFCATFILPRYQTYFMTGLLPFAGAGWCAMAAKGRALAARWGVVSSGGKDGAADG
jgi:hypothetical protein